MLMTMSVSISVNPVRARQGRSDQSMRVMPVG
jgi:hypothetical protein